MTEPMPKYTIEDARRAAKSGEVLYAPHQLKAMIAELLGVIDTTRLPFLIWRGSCGHVWDRAIEDTDVCPRCRRTWTRATNPPPNYMPAAEIGQGVSCPFYGKRASDGQWFCIELPVLP